MEFRPMHDLAGEAAASAFQRLLQLPRRTKIIFYVMVTGVLFAGNFLQAYENRFSMHHLPLWRWLGAMLVAPAIFLSIPVVCYAFHRATPPVSITARGLRFGIWGHLLPFWKPVSCTLVSDPITPHVHHLFIRCQSPLSPRPGVIYEALTSDVLRAEMFIDAFEEKYPPSASAEL